MNRFMLFVFCACAAINQAAGPFKPGDTFPDLSTFGLEGTIPEHAGKVVLIDFFASWCAPCHESFPVMEELYRRYGSQGFVIIAVSVDKKKQEMERFLKRHGATFHILRDPTGKLAGEAKLPAMPTSYLVDRRGRIRSIHTGFRGEETRKNYVSEIEGLLK